MVRARLLLPEDADRLIAQAAGSSVLPSNPNDPVARRVCATSDKDDDDDRDDDD